MLRDAANGYSTEKRAVALPKEVDSYEPHSKHRVLLPLYDLSPVILLECFIAPNATIVGEVLIGQNTAVWYGAVIRGDINSVKIGSSCIIGDNTVIHTAGSLPTGIPAGVSIGHMVNIQSNCTIYSADIADECLIGHKSVVLEGARLERGCAIGPNSVVPPGRIIPSGQLWAGNPVEYVRDLSKGEIQNIIHTTRQNYTKLMNHKYEFLPYNSAYLQKDNAGDDLDPKIEDLKDVSVTSQYFKDKGTKSEIY